MSVEVHTSPSTRAVRLNPFEEGYWRGDGRIALVCRIDGTVDEQILARVLRRLERRHPKLRAVTVSESDGYLRYEPHRQAPPLPLDVLDVEGDELPWREATRTLLDMGLPTQRPLGGVTLIRDRVRARSILIFSVHHGVADGRSGIMLLGDLLADYATLEAQPNAPQGTSFPILSEARASHAVGWRNRLRLAHRFLRLQIQEYRIPQLALPTCGDVAPLSQWVHWVLSPRETVALIRRCRKEQTSLNGVMVAATYCGLRDCLPPSGRLFKWHSAFDVRDLLMTPTGPITGSDMGVFMSAVRSLERFNERPALWDLARRFHEEMQLFERLGGPAVGFNVMRARLTQSFVKSEGTTLTARSKRPTLFATNYGVVDLHDAYGSLRPRECAPMFRGDPIAGPWLTMEALVLNQRLNLGFAADCVDPGFWTQLVAAVRRHLDDASRASDDSPPIRAD